MELFILLLFGHLFGDYLFQNDWMALNKHKKVWPLFVHCYIYSLTVFVFIGVLLHISVVECLILFGCIFLSHIILDGTSLIDRWFRLTQGRSWKRLNKSTTATEWTASIAYTAIVQTVADNTIHLVLMYFLCYFII